MEEKIQKLQSAINKVEGLEIQKKKRLKIKYKSIFSRIRLIKVFSVGLAKSKNPNENQIGHLGLKKLDSFLTALLKRPAKDLAKDTIIRFTSSHLETLEKEIRGLKFLSQQYQSLKSKKNPFFVGRWHVSRRTSKTEKEKAKKRVNAAGKRLIIYLALYYIKANRTTHTIIHRDLPGVMNRQKKQHEHTRKNFTMPAASRITEREYLFAERREHWHQIQAARKKGSLRGFEPNFIPLSKADKAYYSNFQVRYAALYLAYLHRIGKINLKDPLDGEITPKQLNKQFTLEPKLKAKIYKEPKSKLQLAKEKVQKRGLLSLDLNKTLNKLGQKLPSLPKKMQSPPKRQRGKKLIELPPEMPNFPQPKVKIPKIKEPKAPNLSKDLQKQAKKIQDQMRKQELKNHQKQMKELNKQMKKLQKDNQKMEGDFQKRMAQHAKKIEQDRLKREKEIRKMMDKLSSQKMPPIKFPKFKEPKQPKTNLDKQAQKLQKQIARQELKDHQQRMKSLDKQLKKLQKDNQKMEGDFQKRMDQHAKKIEQDRLKREEEVKKMMDRLNSQKMPPIKFPKFKEPKQPKPNLDKQAQKLQKHMAKQELKDHQQRMNDLNNQFKKLEKDLRKKEQDFKKKMEAQAKKIEQDLKRMRDKINNSGLNTPATSRKLDKLNPKLPPIPSGMKSPPKRQRGKQPIMPPELKVEGRGLNSKSTSKKLDKLNPKLPPVPGGMKSPPKRQRGKQPIMPPELKVDGRGLNSKSTSRKLDKLNPKLPPIPGGMKSPPKRQRGKQPIMPPELKVDGRGLNSKSTSKKLDKLNPKLPPIPGGMKSPPRRQRGKQPIMPPELKVDGRGLNSKSTSRKLDKLNPKLPPIPGGMKSPGPRSHGKDLISPKFDEKKGSGKTPSKTRSTSPSKNPIEPSSPGHSRSKKPIKVPDLRDAKAPGKKTSNLDKGRKASTPSKTVGAGKEVTNKREIVEPEKIMATLPKKINLKYEGITFTVNLPGTNKKREIKVNGISIGEISINEKFKDIDIFGKKGRKEKMNVIIIPSGTLTSKKADIIGKKSIKFIKDSYRDLVFRAFLKSKFGDIYDLQNEVITIDGKKHRLETVKEGFILYDLKKGKVSKGVFFSIKEYAHAAKTMLKSQHQELVNWEKHKVTPSHSHIEFKSPQVTAKMALDKPSTESSLTISTVESKGDKLPKPGSSPISWGIILPPTTAKTDQDKETQGSNFYKNLSNGIRSITAAKKTETISKENAYSWPITILSPQLRKLGFNRTNSIKSLYAALYLIQKGEIKMETTNAAGIKSTVKTSNNVFKTISNLVRAGSTVRLMVNKKSTIKRQMDKHSQNKDKIDKLIYQYRGTRGALFSEMNTKSKRDYINYLSALKRKDKKVILSKADQNLLKKHIFKP